MRTLEKFYFNKYEDKKPYDPVPDNEVRTWIFQFLAIITICLGAGYLYWRWANSLNPDALWFAIPLVIAETLSFVGTGLMIFNFWSNKEIKAGQPIHYLSDMEPLKGRADRPIKIDVFIASYNEEVELVRYSIRDAKNMDYPFDDVRINVFLLDDGRRDGRDPEKENMKQVCEEEGIHYLNREDNAGYKAGNLKNAMERTDGDLIVILDADTRPFPEFLTDTTGYFRDKKMAWVQTPQWFYDVTEPVPMRILLKKWIGLPGYWIGKGLDRMFGELKSGEDIFGNDPRMFYESILRKRNYWNAAFCCGAGSIHRREAVMSLAVRDFIQEVHRETEELLENENLKNREEVKKKSFVHQEIKPFKFHASEDIYTSMMLHCDRENWKSYQHPKVECKMLSPQDLDSCIKQRTRYAQGSLDIAFKDNPLWLPGLSFGQRMCYLNTIWSYFAPVWIIIFLLAPIVFFFTHELPVKAFSFDFFKWFIAFQVLNTITITLGAWGIPSKRGEQYYVASFWLNMRSIWAAIKGEAVKFNVTPKSKKLADNMQHIWPHLIIIGLTVIGIGYNLVLVYLDIHPSWSGFVSNFLWGFYNAYNLSIILHAAYWDDEKIQAELATEREDMERSKSEIAVEI